MKKKKRAPKKLIIILFFLIIIIMAFQIAPNYKKQIRNSNINLIYNNKNITTNLTHELILKDEIVYMCIEDIKNIIDSNILFEESSNKIVTVCNTKVTAIDINSQNMYINSAQIPMKNSIITQNENYYLPLSELENVYNIEVDYKENTNICIVNEKNAELVGARVKKNTKVKAIKENMSLAIQKLESNEEVILMNNQNDGWMQILTKSGKIGYIKENRIKEQYYIRENMEKQNKEIETESITNISKLRKIKTPTIEQIQAYDGRATIIEKIVDEAIKNKVHVLEVNYDKIKQENEPVYNRFLLELEAGLKDVGIMLKK